MNMAKKQIKQSETGEIMRSQINLNPFNPKRHTDKKVQEQKKNFMRVGFMGGITWNRPSGNLIDGHRRIKAMDLYYSYDGTPQTDYLVKVEAVKLDIKQEKEQMTYMALGNTKADYQLIAEYLPDIDYAVAGIDEYDLLQIQSFIPQADDISRIESYDDLIEPTDDGPVSEDNESDSDSFQDSASHTYVSGMLGDDEKKARIKEAKREQKKAAGERYRELTSYLTISFSSAEEKRMFCELAGIGEEEKFIQGRKVLEMIE